MSAIMAFLGTKMGLAALAGGTFVGGFLAKKFIPGIVSKYMGMGLAMVLDPKTEDPVEKKLIRDFALAAVRLAEYKVPDAGLGDTRKVMVSKFLQKMIPAAQADLISDIIEQAVVTMDAELKKAGQQ